MSINEADILAARSAMVEAADAMRRGTSTYIDGAHLICGLQGRSRLRDFDPAFVPFRAVDGETTHIPIGKARDQWPAEALARMEPERERLETWAKQFLDNACRNLAAELRKRPIV